MDGLFDHLPDRTITLLNILTTSPDLRMFIGNAHGVLWVQGYSNLAEHLAIRPPVAPSISIATGGTGPSALGRSYL